MKQNIGFVIVVYKIDAVTLENLKKCLRDNLVVVVDNTENNKGFGAGANTGMQKLIGQGVGWAVVLNQDIEMTKEAVGEFCGRLKKLAPGITGPFVGSLDPKRWTTVLPSKKVGYISGSCMAIHSDIFKKIGFFYDPYFMYYEDVDYCIRAKKAGFPIIPLSIAGISHEDGTSLGKGSLLHQYYLARNHLLFVERNAPVRVKIHELARLPKTVWEHWKRGEAGALVGIRDYFLRRFGQYTPL